MKAFVTGGAGFIGSNLVDKLLEKGFEVTAFDNFTTGQENFLKSAKRENNFRLVKGDILNKDLLKSSMDGHNIIFHLSANADVRFGLKSPTKDLEQNTIGTSNVLEAMRLNNIKKIAFSSTGSVYGDIETIPTPENSSFPIQTSLYAASKLSGEALISSYCNGYDFRCWIFRFVSILGERYSHGHVFDFYKQLKKNPNQLQVLGDGHQKKSYLYIKDCIDAMMFAIRESKEQINIFNLGTDQYCEVIESINWINEELGLTPQIKFTGGKRGWIGDNPFIYLDTKKIRHLGWKPKLTIEAAIKKTVRFLSKNEWIFKERK